jgi:chromosome segregation ATPase
MPAAGSISMSQGRTRSNVAAPRQGLGVGNRQEDVPPTLDTKLRALQVGLEVVMDSIRQLEKSADTVSKQFTVDISRLVDVQPETGTLKRLEKIFEALNANAERLHRLELDSLERERRLDKERLQRMEKEVRAANFQVERLAHDLDQAQLRMVTPLGRRMSGTRRPWIRTKPFRLRF